ncbi:MAG TPA: serine/threonine-protein kinase [Gemmatimonadales bacterium]|nr:serine/threonine-protein kinase [Gemmatimonadales bacterium]
MQNLSAASSPQFGTESDPPVSPTLVGRTLPGNLRILSRLGQIPEGSLYSAQYPTGVEVTVVTLEAESTDRTDGSILLLRLQQKLQHAIQIKHPNVAAVYEVGRTSDGLVYVVLEQVAGEPLSNILAVRGTVSLHEALNLCLQAAAGLEAAHKVGLVHGNLSPSTILISEADGHTRVKLIRFPLASLRGQPGDPAIDIAGSAKYASPERLAGQQPDPRCDVFSLGAVLHHLLTGVPPKESLIGSGPKVTRDVLTQALDPAPPQRFQTIAEFARALEHAAAMASGPKLTTPNRFVTRSVAGIGLVVITAAGLWLAGSARRQPAGADRPARATATRAPPAAHVATPQKNGGSVTKRDSALGRPKQLENRRSSSLVTRARDTVKRTSEHLIPKKDSLPAAGLHGSDSSRQPRLSPFRRAHPWAAVPGQRFYFRSSCEVALQSTDLLYFKSEKEARAEGFEPSTVPGCH